MADTQVPSNPPCGYPEYQEAQEQEFLNNNIVGLPVTEAGPGYIIFGDKWLLQIHGWALWSSRPKNEKPPEN